MAGADMATNNNDDGRLREFLVIAGATVALGIIEAFKPSHLALLAWTVALAVGAYFNPPRPESPRPGMAFFRYLILISLLALNYAYEDKIWGPLHLMLWK